MKEKVKVRGKFRLYLQWPLYLSALFIIMGLFSVHPFCLLTDKT